MDLILIFVIFLLAAVLLLILFAWGRARGGSVYFYVLEQTIRKDKNKAKILKLLAGQGSLTNVDIREALGVSAASTVRYMDELEKEGKVEQVGDTGRGVAYRLKIASRKNTSTR